MIKDRLTRLIETALSKTDLNITEKPLINLEEPPNKSFGDYSSNIALLLARQAKMAPRKVAEKLIEQIPTGDGVVERVEVAGAGFINFYLNPQWLYDVLLQIDKDPQNYGKSDEGAGQGVLVEYVSCNPTGPVTLGNGRGGSIGDTMANLYQWMGYRVGREFYINDAQNSLQMQVFGRTLEARYLQLLGQDAPIPEDGYQGEYVTEIAQRIYSRDGDKYVKLPDDERIALFTRFALEEMLEQQKKDLESFGIHFNNWFSESTLHESNQVHNCIEKLTESGYVYESDGAKWFKSTAFGDDKDRVIVRSNGKPTYLAADIAYHRNKFERGYTKLVDVWGSDHHGYIVRTKAAMQALGYDSKNMDILIYQFVRLFSGGEMVRMSKRAGDIIPLSDVVEQVGKDASRFFFLMRSADSLLDFDMDLAKQQSAENPVYYVQYGHARICSIIRQAEETGIAVPKADSIDLTVLKEDAELDLIRKLSDFPEEIKTAADNYAPHRLTSYSMELATLFHKFYTVCRVLGEEPPITAARLVLCNATRSVLKNVLAIMGIDAPEKM